MNRAIFWDLQGTLGGDAVASIELFEPFPFAKDALKLAKDNGYRNIVITNQSRISKGSLSAEAYEKESQRIIRHFNADEVLLEEILCCPHQNKDQCNCKKPKTGLIEYSIRKYNLDIKRCFVVGDMGKNEIVMAHHAGCKGVLVLTGGGKDSLGIFRDTWRDHEADMIADNALEAVKKIIADAAHMHE
ncbi:MAG: HAD-IIIA family hydrolase [Christensenellaceae bacterium]|nr:HAD-IIIA family hydrolase [Christensenellaceae bacterium]